MINWLRNEICTKSELTIPFYNSAVGTSFREWEEIHHILKLIKVAEKGMEWKVSNIFSRHHLLSTGQCLYSGRSIANFRYTCTEHLSSVSLLEKN